MSMQGFHEHGEPRDWDMAVGTVRGYRWWVLHLPFEQGYGMPSYRKGDFYASSWKTLQQLADFQVPAGWRPVFGRAKVLGMHSGAWSKISASVNGGWHQAKCGKIYWPSSEYAFGNAIGPHHAFIPDSGCGCGFWAYWDQLKEEWDACRPYVRVESSSKFSVSVPLGGVIEGSGRTIIGEKGFRCEKAKITDLALNLRASCTVEHVNREQMGVYDQWNVSATPYGLYSSYTEKRPFLPYMETACLMDEQELTAVFRAAVEDQIGDRFTWHKSPVVLTGKCPPDVNYGNR